jgi:hypothetical protein
MFINITLCFFMLNAYVQITLGLSFLSSSPSQLMSHLIYIYKKMVKFILVNTYTDKFFSFFFCFLYLWG